ncbi:AAA family ATPase [Lentisalinibacter orientalis]|jgi:MoxR-like ATPase|uniref:AAA family ATPase n=1 Tax=Lentisalinibacter orientalis TaxID=2992241 RepID=UPI00386FCDBC
MHIGNVLEKDNAIDDGIGDALTSALASLDSIILGKGPQLRLALACLIARGHLLIEDLPGVGKTTLAHALARVLGLTYQRIQFTSDMLPADIVGVSIYRPEDGRFDFHPGPVFSQLVLADEVNRATPKAQSALLEAMQEGQVTVDGASHTLPEPFFVVATQNPGNQIGTFPLPESQLDRFLMRIELGYPDEAAERRLLAGHDTRLALAGLEPALGPDDVVRLQRAVDAVKVSEPLIDYIQALVRYTRESGDFPAGLSPRGAIALTRAARAIALVEGREAVFPDDVQAVFTAVAAHRLTTDELDRRRRPEEIGRHVLESVAIP